MDKELREILLELKHVPHEIWKQYIISKDLYARHFKADDYAFIAKKATEVGNALAENTLAKYGSISEILSSMNLNLSYGTKDQFLMPNKINFAQYYNNSILMSQEFIHAIESDKAELIDIFGDFEIEDLIISHELFHYFEEKDLVSKNAGVKINVNIIPFIKQKISPDSAGEIAAFAFSQAFCHYNFYPCCMEAVYIWKQNPKLLIKIRDKLIT